MPVNDRTRPRGLSVGLVDARSVDAAGRRAWTELADRAAEPNPFLRPEVVLAAAGARAPTVLLAVVREHERWLACLPVSRAARWGRIPLPVLGPWLADYAYLATPLVDRDSVARGVDGLLELLVRERRAAAVVLDPVDPSGPVGAALLAGAHARGAVPVVTADFERAELRRRPEPTYLQEAMGASSRKKLRKAARTLADDLGGPLEVVERAGEPAAVDAFLALERAGWKGEAGTALASDPADGAFFRGACAALAAAGRLQLLSLEAGGRTAAMQCNFLDAPDLYAFKVAYDPALARHSPGAVLEVEAVDRFHAATELLRADSCAAPDSPLINRMWPDRRRLQTVLLPTSAPYARLLEPLLGAERVARRAHRRLRRADEVAA